MSYKSATIKDPRKSFFSRRKLTYIGVVFLIVALYAGFAIFFNQPKFALTDASVEGALITNEEDIKLSVFEIAKDSSILPFFRGTIFLFLNKESMAKQLEERFPRLSSVEIEKFEPDNTLKITVSERRGSFLWCQGFEMLGDEKHRCGFVDENGVYFDDAPLFTGFSYPRFFTENSDFAIGDAVVSKEKLEALDAYWDGFTELGFSLYGARIYESDFIDLVILDNKKIGENSPFIKLLTSADRDVVIQNYQSALVSEEFGPTLRDVGDLEYVDLRFDRRVIIKPRE